MDASWRNFHSRVKFGESSDLLKVGLLVNIGGGHFYLFNKPGITGAFFATLNSDIDQHFYKINEEILQKTAKPKKGGHTAHK